MLFVYYIMNKTNNFKSSGEQMSFFWLVLLDTSFDQAKLSFFGAVPVVGLYFVLILACQVRT